MGWRLVKQPNGKLARFSEVVDDFTHFDLTDSEALSICLEHGCSADEAMGKVRRAHADEELYGQPWNEPKDGLNRWRDALKDIARVHGIEAKLRSVKLGTAKPLTL